MRGKGDPHDWTPKTPCRIEYQAQYPIQCPIHYPWKRTLNRTSASTCLHRSSVVTRRQAGSRLSLQDTRAAQAFTEL